MDNFIKISKPSGNRNGLGFKHISKQKEKVVKKYSFIYQKAKKPLKSNITSNIKNIKIWIPKTNNNLIRQKHIDNFLNNVVYNKNYVCKGTNPTWVWLPSTPNI